MGLFLDYDAQTIHDKIIGYLQSAAGEVFPDGDERRIFAEAMTAYMLAILADIDDVAKQKDQYSYNKSYSLEEFYGMIIK